MMNRSNWMRLVAAVTLIAATGCGGDPKTPAESPKTSAAPSTPSTAPKGSSAANTPAKPAEQFDVDIVPAKISQQPNPGPKVNIELPGIDQYMPANFTKDYKVRSTVRNWDKLPEGSYVRFLIDHYPSPPIKDPKAVVKLLDIAQGGNLSDGEHVIAAVVCRSTGESYKLDGGASVNRFWVGKKTPGEWKGHSPMLILDSPALSYKGKEAEDILIDFFVLNAEVSDKANFVRFTVKGPGIKEEGITRNVTEWRPYTVVSAHNGEYTIEAELVDKNGTTVPGAWNTIKRTFKVERD